MPRCGREQLMHVTRSHSGGGGVGVLPHRKGGVLAVGEICIRRVASAVVGVVGQDHIGVGQGRGGGKGRIWLVVSMLLMLMVVLVLLVSVGSLHGSHDGYCLSGNRARGRDNTCTSAAEFGFGVAEVGTSSWKRVSCSLGCVDL